MKNYLKKGGALFFVILLIIGTAVQTLAVSDNNKNFDRLLSFGYEETFLQNLSDSALEKIVDLIGDNEVVSVENKKENKYVGKGYDMSASFITAVALLKDKSSGNITGEAVSMFWEWTGKKPLVKGEDSILVGWDSKKLCFESDSFYGEDYSKKGETDSWTVEKTYTTLPSITQSQLYWFTDLSKLKKHNGGFGAFGLLATDSTAKAQTYEHDGITVNYEHNIRGTVNIILKVSSILLIVLIIVLIVCRIRKKKKKAA